MADIEHMKSERTDAIEEIEREISVRERDPAYKTFSRGIVNGLEMALRIINEKRSVSNNADTAYQKTVV